MQPQNSACGFDIVILRLRTLVRPRTPLAGAYSLAAAYSFARSFARSFVAAHSFGEGLKEPTNATRRREIC